MQKKSAYMLKIEDMLLCRIIFSIDLYSTLAFVLKWEALTYKSTKMPLSKALKEVGSKLIKYISKGNT